MSLQTIFPNLRILAHKMNSYTVLPYDSAKPSTISDQLDVLALNGIKGFIDDWQGPTVNAHNHAAAMETCRQAGRRGMLYGLCLDPWICKNASNKTDAMIAAIGHPDTQKMLNSPAYLPEKYMLDFSTGADFVKVSAAFPQITFLQKHTGFSWPETKDTLAIMAIDNANESMRIPGLCLRFNDGGWKNPDGTIDYGKSVWSSAVSTRDVQSQLSWDQVDLANKTSHAQYTGYVQLVTYNDYAERTDMEQWLSWNAGVRVR